MSLQINGHAGRFTPTNDNTMFEDLVEKNGVTLKIEPVDHNERFECFLFIPLFQLEQWVKQCHTS